MWEGVYYENVVVNKILSLIGNGSETTVIDGMGIGNAMEIRSVRCNVSGFTMKNGVW